MDTNQKKFGIYVFLSTFSRNLIEVFIPVILFKFGFDLKSILFYYFIANAVSLIISYPFVYLSQKFNYKILSIIGIVAFLILQILLNFMTHNIWYLFSIAVLYAVYRRGYWIARRYYNLKVIKNNDISTTYSIISIINQIGVIVSAYLGSIILDYISLNILTIIAIVLFTASIVPLYFLTFKKDTTNTKIELCKTLRQIPKNNIYLFGSYELLNVVKFLIPLYIFIYVKNTYQTIGIVNLITNLSLIVFTYLFGKTLDKSKNNFLIISVILTVIVFTLKVNSVGYALLLISALEGFVTKMYELSINKEFYTLSKKFEYNNYNLTYETVQNSFRTFVTLIFVIFNLKLKTMIYITLLCISISIFFNKNNNKIIQQKLQN